MTGPTPPAQLLRQALSAKDPAAQLRLVRGLRALRDPALAPLFAQMSMSASQALRAEGILGMAEVEAVRAERAGAAAPGIDLLPVRKLEPIAQAVVLSEALERKLLPIAQLEDLARWPDLQPGLYVSVAGRVVAEGKRLDPTRLRQIATDLNDPIVSVVASILQVQLGSKEAVAAATGDRLLSAKAKGVGDAARRILMVIRERKLAAGAPFARRAIELQGSDRLLRFEAVGTLLVIEPSGDRVTSLLAAEMKLAPDVAERTRLALAAASAALHRADGIPPAALQLLKSDPDPLIAELGEAVDAAVSRSNAVPAFSALVARRSAPILAWVIRACDRLPSEEAKAVRLALVGSAVQTDDRAIEVSASEAAAALAESDPAALVPFLTTALEKRDDRTAGRILASALRTTNPAAATLAGVGRSPLEKNSPLPAWTSPAVEAIATVLRARHAPALGPEQIERLSHIAIGSGNLPESTRIQAAWIALKGSTGDTAALSRILADLAP